VRSTLAFLAVLIETISIQPLHAQGTSLRLGPPVIIGEDHEFTYVTQAALGPNGLLAVAQPGDHTVLLFDLAKPARPVASAGRRGEGPGEFGSVGQVGWIGPQLWVTDGSRPRAEFFDPRGRVIGSQVFDRPSSPARNTRFFAPTAMLRDSVALFVPSAIAGPVALPPGAAEAVVPILLHQPRQNRYDTLAQIRPVRSVMVLVGDRGASVSSQPLVGTDFVRTGVDGQRILLVLQSSPTVPDGRVRVEVRTATGSLIFGSDLGLRGKEVTSREWDALFARYVASNRGETWSTRALATAGLRAALHRPRYMPVIADAVLGQDGTIWLRKHSDRGKDAEWLVLSPAGAVQGSVVLPAATRILDVTAERVVGTSRDADDVETLFWARILDGR
jgi:hypothetical protein